MAIYDTSAYFSKEQYVSPTLLQELLSHFRIKYYLVCVIRGLDLKWTFICKLELIILQPSPSSNIYIFFIFSLYFFFNLASSCLHSSPAPEASWEFAITYGAGTHSKRRVDSFVRHWEPAARIWKRQSLPSKGMVPGL